MLPTLDLGWTEISIYTALVYLGAVIGLATAFLFLRAFSRRVYSLGLFLDAAILTFAAGWIGARGYHVALNWEYYSTRSDQILNWEAGGLALRGAFVAGFAALAIFARVRAVSFGRLADAAGLGLAVGQAVGWVGAYVQGANYGAVSDSLMAMELPNLYGIVEPRFPLQLAAIVFYGILFAVLVVLASRQPAKGKIFLIYLFVASLGNFALGFFRGDETQYVGALRVDQIFDAAFALSGLGWWARALRVSSGNAFSNSDVARKMR